MSAWDAVERVQSGVAPHLLFLDLPRAQGDSLQILRWLRRLRPELPVVVVCHPEDAMMGKEATRLGAGDVLMRPFDEYRLECTIRKNLGTAGLNTEVEIVSDDVESLGGDEFFFGVSPAMHKLRAQAELLAQADVPVLIIGERGTGKGVVARLIHKHSVYSGFDFLRVNCAALPGDLLEIELFGRTNTSTGSAVGVGRTGSGKLAGKGTLLLEEITEMPLSLQSRLVQVLHEKQFVPCGHATPIDVGCRILAATSANLDRALAEKRVREDLYYRLSAFTVHVPPLRQRKEEIKILLQYSMRKLARYYGLPGREFTPAALAACMNHSWPGNQEELESFVKRYLVAGDRELGLGGDEAHPGSNHDGIPATQSLKSSMTLYHEVDPGGEGTGRKSLKSLIQSVKSEAERNAIAAALETTAWNRKAAARLLQVSYRTLLYKIDQYHMQASEPTVSTCAESQLAVAGNRTKGAGKAG
jgi:DNA-binding NtrC family response regulator